MTDTILTVVWPFASAVIASVAEVLFARTKAFGKSHVRDLKLPKLIWQIKWKDKTGETALSFLIIWTSALLQFLFAMASLFVIRRCANLPQETAASPVSSAFFAVMCIVSDICIIYLLRGRNRKASKAAVIIAVMSFLVLACELFLFNFNCFKNNTNNITIKGSRLLPEFASDADDEEGPIRFEGESVLVKSECSLMIPNVPDDAYCIKVDFSGEPVERESRFRLRLMIEDSNSMYEYRSADIRKISGLRNTTLFMKPYGNIKSVMLCFELIQKTVRVDSVTISNRNFYSVSFIRYLVILICIALVSLIVSLKLYRIDFDSSKASHALLLLFVFVITTGLTFPLYYRSAMKLDKYPFEDTSEINDIYQLAFDSSMKRIPYLDVPADEELAKMDNPYDSSEREAKKVTYRWDYAYKDGKYYSYFGMAPVYTVYYPVYLITHRVPNYASAVAIFGTIACAAVIFAFLAAVRMFVPKKNLLLLLLMIPAVASASLVYTNMMHAEKYYIACESAIATIAMAVFFGLTAVKSRRFILRLILFFLSGLSLAFCAGSRPSVAVCAAILLPVFFVVLFDKKRKAGQRFSEALVFVIPVLAGIALILMHNQARFGNIFDFGENYQLTVSDISSLKATPEMFPSAIYYYFLMPFSAMDTFPYFEARGVITYTYEVFRNIEPSAGILNIPLILLGLVFAPGTFMKTKDKPGRKDAAVYNAFIIVCFVTSLFITWFNFSRGGVCLRYLSDFAWILSISGAVVLLRRVMKKSGRKTVYGLICAACVLTVLVGFSLVLTGDTYTLTKTTPTLLERCEDFFLFWH